MMAVGGIIARNANKTSPSGSNPNDGRKGEAMFEGYFEGKRYCTMQSYFQAVEARGYEIVVTDKNRRNPEKNGVFTVVKRKAAS